MMNRVIERSRTEVVTGSNTSKKVETGEKVEIPLIGYEEFKKNVEAGTKVIIKLLKN